MIEHDWDFWAPYINMSDYWVGDKDKDKEEVIELLESQYTVV